MADKRRVLFYRSLKTYNSGTNGGHLKVRDTFEHFKHSDHFEPRVYFSEDTKWFDNPGNYWLPYKAEALNRWNLKDGDVLMFSGKDWTVLAENERANPPVPVINIVQPRHTRQEDPRRLFLQYPAIRVAKSVNGARILKDHGVNGPLVVIPDSIDLSLFPKHREKDIDVLVLGLKQEELARRIGRALKLRRLWTSNLSKVHVQLPPKLPTRQAFIDLLSRAKIVVCLPLDEKRGYEGFYLPALEAMACGSLVIVPHAVGNKDHCRHEENCLVPEFDFKSIMQMTLRALKMPKVEKSALIHAGFETAKAHDIQNERQAFLSLLHQVDELWNDKSNFKFP